jgi:1-deoxy-D-xylulose-5-phosphate reductoisomerase
MTFPIQHALLHPERPRGTSPPLDFSRLISLDFRPVDEDRFPMLRLAREAMQAGGSAPAVFNAANEVAVAAFLAERIPFLAISRVVEHTLGQIAAFDPPDLAAVLMVDSDSRRVAEIEVGNLQDAKAC